MMLWLYMNAQNATKKSKTNITSSITWEIECMQCHFKTFDDITLKRHISSKHEGYSPKVKCDQCEYKASRQSYLKEHKQSAHEGINFKCDKCDFETSRKAMLRKHISFKHDKIVHQCDQCGHQTPYIHMLRSHVEIVHEGLGIFKCDQCDRNFAVKRYFKDPYRKWI